MSRRLVCGSLGTLGVIADVSLKVLPAPEVEITVAFESDRWTAHRSMLDLSNRSLPVSGLAWFDETLLVRFSGADAAVNAARREVGGDEVRDLPWAALADYSFFDAGELWRISVAPAATTLLDVARVIDWGGAQRWLVDPEFDPRAELEGGHATLVIGDPASGVTRLQPLSAPVHAIHQRLKATLDPEGRLNPGRLYPDI
ncbi:MAG: hypothetical protein U5O39_13185 [Gammaproteobacteria bacterium]|nr:hypothetical protein [Gammaproteobacteria bacterium]